jgi:hypothetical protein
MGLELRNGGTMKAIINLAWKIFSVGGWAPLLVVTIHGLLRNPFFDLYKIWPETDIPMHFFGGVSFAFFVSRCFQELPRGSVQRSRSVILELALIGSLTATAAVFWEFAEFTTDQLFDRNVQVSLANTIRDMALGVAGSVAFILLRAKQLRFGRTDFQEITRDWIHGKAA